MSISITKNYFLLHPANRTSLPEEVTAKLQQAKSIIVIEADQYKQLVEITSFKSLKPIFKSASFSIYDCNNKVICFANSITNFNVPSLQSNCDIKIFTIQHLSSFKDNVGSETTYVMRQLSAGMNIDSDIPSLEVPNFISGFSAKIGSLSKLQDLPFICYIAYISDFDEINLKKILQVFKDRLNIIDDANFSGQCLYSNSNLYS
jgi:hypothetical protein